MKNLAATAVIALALALASPTIADPTPYPIYGIAIMQVEVKMVAFTSGGGACGEVSDLYRVYLDGTGVSVQCRWQTRCDCYQNVEVGQTYWVEFQQHASGGAMLVDSITEYPQ